MKFLIFFLAFFANTQIFAKPYFAAESIAPSLLNPPPTINENEINQIIKLQKNFDLTEIDEALAEKQLRPETILLAVDEKFSRQSYPKLYHFLDRVSETSHQTTDKIKSHWNKTRPYLADSRVNMLISPSFGGSYPAGHTTGSYIYAHILSLLLPQKRQDFFSIAEKISQHRILVGMHYPSDASAGKQLALLIIGAMTQKDEFQKDFMKAKEEIEISAAKIRN
ncbi:MAG: hypothetical protein A2887_00705 [Alphaproteobacteria bacterium RIFCSPLOWO2_01_FULL_40_26]|nr:MAG: hypothetical protein A3D15_02605 [Alphaproteobacteria bacterium RIFCSPHIGHO2_02_FULL_40_34]OFW94339.1 MAG: hypothetical protein A2887_00705 [Alphaproteobacteria bacterium RIFCSPLOWO2_01_FULL_40_26]OFX09726.1 MAG: hypothetical protein A3H30_00110 [Alphaproteobacteria bacterium RIFCSPLOWO2_02_FULL_40_19]OFX11617.1 MAG: hypothetical protein A3G22_02895 [Alphaproteobacteria bacterium RIFCSPLOWO2_12_FULL_40_11]